MMDYKTPIVLDTGSGLMKAGFADQERPSTIFPTIVGRPKYEASMLLIPFIEKFIVFIKTSSSQVCFLSSQEVMNGSVEREMYIGHEAQHMRGVLALQHPIKNGIVRNWDDMEKVTMW